MRFSVAFVASLVALVSAAPNAEHIFKRACNGDLCLRAINDPSTSAQASSACSAYFSTVVTPCPVTTTASVTVTTTASGSTITAQTTSSFITTQTIYNVVTFTAGTFTNNATSTVTSTSVSTRVVTSTVTSGSLGLSMKKRQASTTCTPVTSSMGGVPANAPSCTGTRYSSACSCIGVTSSSASTLPASTVTITNTFTSTMAGNLTTTTSYSNVSSTVFQTLTNTTTVGTSTTITATVNTTTAFTSTTTTVTSTSVVPSCSSIVLRVSSGSGFVGNYVTDAGTMSVSGNSANAEVFTLLANGTVAHYDPMNSRNNYFLATDGGKYNFVNKEYLSQSNGQANYKPLFCKVDPTSKEFICRAVYYVRSAPFVSCPDQPGALFIGGVAPPCTQLTLTAVARCSGPSTVA